MNKRKDYRAPIDIPARILTTTGFVCSVNLDNISLRGIRLTSNPTKMLTKGTQFVVEYELNGKVYLETYIIRYIYKNFHGCILRDPPRYQREKGFFIKTIADSRQDELFPE